MSTTYECVNNVTTLKTNIENITGGTYNDLTSAVQGLKNKYTLNDTSFVVDTKKLTNFFGFCYGGKFLDNLDKLDTSNGTNFSYMFGSGGIKVKTIPPLDTSSGTNFSHMFDACYQLESIPQLDTSKGTSFSYMFWNCSGLTSIPQLNTSQCGNFQCMFGNCSNLTIIPHLDISNGTNLTNMFMNCSALQSVSLSKPAAGASVSTMFNGCTALTNLTIGQGWSSDLFLTSSTNLTQESLHSIIENLADLTGLTYKTFRIGSVNLAKIDEEHIAMLNAKNWKYS